MAALFDDFGINAGFVEEQFLKFLENPQLVDESWRKLFTPMRSSFSSDASAADVAAQGMFLRSPAGAPQGHTSHGSNGISNGHAGSYGEGEALPSGDRKATTAPLASHAFVTEVRAVAALEAYRTQGHLGARINPLFAPASPPPEVTSARAALEGSLDEQVTVELAGKRSTLTVRELLSTLEESYCGSLGVELGVVENTVERAWLAARVEATRNHRALTLGEKRRILSWLTRAESLEQFLHKNFVGAKRFSIEGGESFLSMLDFLVDDSAALGVEEIVLGMAHRGRLNVLIGLLGKDVRTLFTAFQDSRPELYLGSGDVKYHLGYSHDRVTSQGKPVHLTLCFNPSHLECVDPVVEGRARAKQDQRGDTQRARVLPVLVHGDAAFMGQGVVPETMNLMSLEGYRTGGTIHIIVNNQVGFTTDATDARSTRYASDMARFLGVPILHVNGDDPEAVAQAALLCAEYRQRFQKDIFVDLLCYRKYGHNEGDEPRFTQPRMYALIDHHPSVREQYAKLLASRGELPASESEAMLTEAREELRQALEDAKTSDHHPHPMTLGGLWKGFRGGPDGDTPQVETRVDRAKLFDLLKRICSWPQDFHVNPKVADILRKRVEGVEKGDKIDWAVGETLAYASLLDEGRVVRMSGQDCRRGTFSHRHAVLRDSQTSERYCPLAQVATGRGSFEIYDSPLSEAGVLGFEYGYSLDSPSALVIWEAQFGDFANSAQVIIDQFLLAAEDKWQRLSGLVLLLPHSYEGQGPEHSSARLERFLQGCAEDNIQVCNLTTPAQIFHALRRQVLRPWRKPLVIMSPKNLLRQKLSTFDELSEGHFQRVIPESLPQDPAKVKRVLLCSGKVYYDLVAQRAARKLDQEVAIVRLEQLYPLNLELTEALAIYRDGTPLLWVQDEPWNMGAWYYLQARLPLVLDNRLPLSCVARAESASPATGSKAAHDLEQKMLLDSAFM